MKCDGCRGSIGGRTAYRCEDCEGFLLCVHCIRSGCHSQHRVVEWSGKTPSTSKGTTNQKKSPQPPKSTDDAIRFSQTCTISPAAASHFGCTQNSSGNRHPVPASSYLPYGVIPSAPPIDKPAIFPESTSKTDEHHESERGAAFRPNDQQQQLPSEGRRNSVRSIGEANAPSMGANVAFYRSLPVGTSRFVKETTGDVKERSFSQGDISVDWEPRKAGETFRRKQLQRSDEGFKAVLQNMSKNGGAEWTGKVVSVHRIENHRLYKLYKSRFKEMERESAEDVQNERILFHGTSADALTNICRDGFNRSYCGRNATAYGDGVYFARSFDYSASSRYSPPDSNGHKYIFQCRVLTGYYSKGEQGLKEPPLIDQEIRFDSVVDDLLNPKIFVVFKDMQSYPEFLITLDA